MPQLTKGVGRALLRGRGIAYLFRDDFSIADAAPIADPLPADVIGGLVVTDTGNDLSVAGGELVSAGATGLGDPGVWHEDGATPVAGLAALFKLNLSATNILTHYSFDNNQAGSVVESIYLASITELRVIANNIQIATVSTYSTATEELVLISRGSGAGFFYLVDGNLIFISDASVVADPTYAGIVRAAASAVAQATTTMRVLQLSGAFAVDYGIATQRLSGARAPGDTFTHEADCIIEFTVPTLPSAAQIELWFRIQDASNYWSVTVDSAGDIDLDEVVAAVPTQRGTAAAVVTAGERIQIRAIGTTITVFDSAARRINYASASNFQTETAGELDTEGTGGAVTDIVSWPVNGHNFTKYFAGA